MTYVNDTDEYDEPAGLAPGALPLDWRLVLGGVLESVGAAVTELAEIPKVLAVQLTSDWKYRRFERDSKHEIERMTSG